MSDQVFELLRPLYHELDNVASCWKSGDGICLAICGAVGVPTHLQRFIVETIDIGVSQSNDL